MATSRVILVDADEPNRDVLAARLRMQGYDVDVAASPAEGARIALAEPPTVVVADLWMPGISGVQLCRLLRSEPATEHVPIILRGPLTSRNRFWAERAGATAYVPKGRMGDLVRAVSDAIARAPEPSAFFTDLGGTHLDIRDRIASHLDSALFESVVASEVRALSMSGEVERLFDLFTQLLTRLTTYRWVALHVPAAGTSPARFGLHAHPERRDVAEAEARAALAIPADLALYRVEDEDASVDERGTRPIVCDIPFGNAVIAHLALGPCQSTESSGLEAGDDALMQIVARELGGPIKMAMLVEESQRLARTDTLTRLLNRRAFSAALVAEISRSERHGWPLSLLLLDIDHFKSINDGHGHAAGDVVLARVAAALVKESRGSDIVGRWGGEEFVVGLTGSTSEAARVAAERMRVALQALEITSEAGAKIPVTASFGVATWEPGDGLDALIERADHAMYAAKTSGRNRVVMASPRSAAMPQAAGHGAADASDGSVRPD